MYIGIWKGSSLEPGHTGILNPDYLPAVVASQADQARCKEWTINLEC